MIKGLTRYVYEYYRYGGMYPWLAAHISRGILPIATYWMTILILHPTPHMAIIGAIISIVATARFLWVIIRHLPGMSTARSIYRDVSVSDDLLACSPWQTLAIRLVDRGILDVDGAFGGEVESLSRTLVDASAHLPTTSLGVTILRRSLHRSLRGAINLRFSLFIEAIKEMVMWPFNTLERVTEMIVVHLPRLYASPGDVMLRVFAPDVVYKYRGVNEMEFEARVYFDGLEADANGYLSQFPSPFLDTVYRIARVPTIIVAGYLLWCRMFETLVVCIIIFGIVGKVSSPGRLDPSTLFEEVNRRFRCDDAISLRDCLMERAMMRRGWYIMIELGVILVSPILPLMMMSKAAEIYDVALRRVAIIDGDAGMCMSSRVYRHLTMMEDIRCSVSTAQMMDEFDGLMARADV